MIKYPLFCLMAFSTLSLFGCYGALVDDPCAGVKCSGHGKCTTQNNKAVCDCDDGYVAVELACQQEGSEPQNNDGKKPEEPILQDTTSDAGDVDTVIESEAGDKPPHEQASLCTSAVSCPNWTVCDPATGGCKLREGYCSSHQDCGANKTCTTEHTCKDTPANPCAAVSCGGGGVCGLDTTKAAQCYCPNTKTLGTDKKTCEDDPALADGNAFFCIVSAGATPTVRVYYKGLTESATSAPSGLKVEFGYTPYKATYPIKEGDYTWSAATFVKGGAGDFGNDVIYSATLPTEDNIDYIFRIAKSNTNWVYCHTGQAEPEDLTSANFLPGQKGKGGSGDRADAKEGLDGSTADSFACGRGTFDATNTSCKCDAGYIAKGITCVFDTFCQETDCGTRGKCNLEQHTCDCDQGTYFDETKKTCVEDPCAKLTCKPDETCNREKGACEPLPACTPNKTKGQFSYCFDVKPSEYSVVVKYNGSATVDFAKSQVMLNGENITSEAQSVYQKATKTFVFHKTGVSDTKYGYVFRLADASGTYLEKPLYVPFWVGDGVKYKGFDWDDGYMYYVMVDRFFDGDSSNNIKSGGAVTNPEKDWKGGDWKGLTAKIKDGYFEKLGVNTIWISSPILNNHKGTVDVGANQTVASWGSYHAYHPLLSAWTHSFQFKNDPFFAKFNHPPTHPFETAFGTPKELHEMINEAHKRGIRILLDFVTNHVHKDSPLYTGPNKKNWFYESQQDCNSAGWGISCTFTSDLPDIAYSSTEAREMMTAHAAWLVHELNIDGFRVDALKHMDLQFTKDMSTVMKAETETTGIQLYMVGETFSFDQGQLMDFVGPDKIQGQFDFPFYQAAQGVRNGGGTLGGIKDYIENKLPYYKNRWSGALMSNFIDNHDVERFNTGGKFFETRVALAVLLTSQQFPLMWQGTEYGAEQTPGQAKDPGNRGMVKFSGLSAEQQKTLDVAQKIGALRQKYIALRRGKRTTLQFEDNKFWVFKLEYNGETVYVAINGTGGNKTANNIPTSHTDKTGFCSNTSVPSGMACVFAK